MTASDYGTVAYDAASGAKLWTARYNGPAGGFDFASSLAVSSDGTKVFVTGSSPGAGTSYDYATVAYNAATGAQLWTARYSGPDAFSPPPSLAVSSDGTKVFITGSRYGAATSYDYATVAYNAATGAQLWVAHYDGQAGSTDHASSLAVSADGARVFVTGSSYGTATPPTTPPWPITPRPGRSCGRSATPGLRTATTSPHHWPSTPRGRRCSSPVRAAAQHATTPPWPTTRRAGRSSGRRATTSRKAARTLSRSRSAPTGRRRSSPGSRFGPATLPDYATVAYNAATGAKLWVARYGGPAQGIDLGRSVAVSRDGTRVFVTGSSTGLTTPSNYATVAYNAANGAQLWTARYNGPANGTDDGSLVVVSPVGPKATVFVTGSSEGTSLDYATIAYLAG
jgi:PQQ-like domain